MDQKADIGLIGLAVMGQNLVLNMSDHGYKVAVYNRTRSRADDWAATYEGRVAASPRAAAEGASVVLVCSGNDDDVRAVLDGPDGALAGLEAGALLVDHTTASAGLARELAAQCADLGASFLDAPVSGGEEGAKNGALTVMVGGEPRAPP